MATTKIWPIKDSLSRVVEYARNPEKTDLHAVLHYAADGIKTYAAETAHAAERGGTLMLMYFNLEIAVR